MWVGSTRRGPALAWYGQSPRGLATPATHVFITFESWRGMRPPDLDVTLRLYQLECKSTEDSGGDEPYMWIVAFKVDAETMVDVPASFIPHLGVKIIEGVPASPFIKGTGEVNAGESPAIPAALGTRWMRLKPALLKTGDWFPGIAGMILSAL